MVQFIILTNMNIETPIGGIIAWIKSFSNVPQKLPHGWAECNGQVLSDAQSIFNGLTLPNLNSDNRFLRGASTSGTTGGADTHSHVTTQDAGLNGNNNAGVYSEATGTTDAVSSLPKYYEVVWIIRIK